MNKQLLHSRITFGSVGMLALIIALISPSFAPISQAQLSDAVVPTLVSFNGTLTDPNGKPMSGMHAVTFSLYKDQQGGAPLWMEVQNATADKYGHYTVALGSTTSQGLPTDLFSSGEARWLAVQPEGQEEQPRVLLLSVPYALKAGDSQTLGGLPVSAFALANSSMPAKAGADASSPATPIKTPSPANPAVTGKGTVDFIPMWDKTSDIINSVLFQKSSLIGIGTISPAATLDVNGKSDVRDTLTLFPKSTDNTLAVSGTTFKVSSKGLMTFVSGQIFPGTGTITGITTATGSGLEGGGTKGTLNLSITSAGVTNAMLTNPSVTLNATSAGGLTAPGAMTLGSTYTIGLKPCATNQILQYTGSIWNCASVGTGTITGVTAGTGLTGGGTSGVVTLNVDTTKVPLLASGNTFTSEQVINTGGFTPGLSVTSGGGIYSTSGSIAITGVTTSGGFGDAGVEGMDQSGQASGVYGFSSGGQGITGGSSTGYGVFGSGSVGVQGTSTNGYGVSGSGSLGVQGTSTSGWGVQGISSSGASDAYGVYGLASNTVGAPLGVYGSSLGDFGVGVFGQQGSTESNTGASLDGHYGAGTWGDAGQTQGNVGVFASADDGSAAIFENNSPSQYYTLFVEAANSITNPFFAYSLGNNSFCYIDYLGDLNCTGSKNAVVPIDGGTRQVAMSAIESPVNWFEDAGSGQLINGVAVVALDPDFVQTVNAEMDYKVFPVPNGDCKGLYITHKTATSFEVRELGGGTSSVAFDYRIMALRRNYESIRFADRTADVQKLHQMIELEKAAKSGPRHSHDAGRKLLPNAVSLRANTKAMR